MALRGGGEERAERDALPGRLRGELRDRDPRMPVDRPGRRFVGPFAPASAGLLRGSLRPRLLAARAPPPPRQRVDLSALCLARDAPASAPLAAHHGDSSHPRSQRVRTHAPRLAGSFAMWGMTFTTIDCALIKARGREDPWNAILSGFTTSGLLSVTPAARDARSPPETPLLFLNITARHRALLTAVPDLSPQVRNGPRAALGSAVFGGVILAMIEGLGVMIGRATAPPPQGLPMPEPMPAVSAPGSGEGEGLCVLVSSYCFRDQPLHVLLLSLPDFAGWPRGGEAGSVWGHDVCFWGWQWRWGRRWGGGTRQEGGGRGRPLRPAKDARVRGHARRGHALRRRFGERRGGGGALPVDNLSRRAHVCNVGLCYRAVGSCVLLEMALWVVLSQATPSGASPQSQS